MWNGVEIGWFVGLYCGVYGVDVGDDCWGW